MTRRTALLLLGSLGWAEVIDRIAVTVDSHVITQSMLTQQIRMAAFQDGRDPVFTPEARRQAAETLVSHALLLQEMDDSRYPDPPMAEIQQQAAKLIVERFPSTDAYYEALARYEIPPQEFLRFLQQQQRAFNFIDIRFRTGQQVSTEEIAEYYEKTFLPDWRKQHPTEPPPPLTEVDLRIEELLMSQRVDAATDEWLKEARASAKIRYNEEAFQ